MCTVRVATILRPMVPPFKIKVVEPIALPARAARERARRGRATTRSCSGRTTSSSTSSPTAAPRRSPRSNGRRWSSATRPTPARAASSGSSGGARPLRLPPRDPGASGTRRGAPAFASARRVRVSACPRTSTSRPRARTSSSLDGVWLDVACAEATDPELDASRSRANIDLDRLEEALRRNGRDGVAFVRQEACVNMAGGQPFSVANLAAVRELTYAARRAALPRRDADLGERSLRQGPRAGLVEPARCPRSSGRSRT